MLYLVLMAWNMVIVASSAQLKTTTPLPLPPSLEFTSCCHWTRLEAARPDQDSTILALTTSVDDSARQMDKPLARDSFFCRKAAIKGKGSVETSSSQTKSRLQVHIRLKNVSAGNKRTL
jgi:hypothetical protein